MNLKPEDIEINVESSSERKSEIKQPSNNKKCKIKIGTRDIALIMAFILIVIGLITEKIDIKWAIFLLLVIASGGTISQFYHNKKSDKP